jgi:hypothetical protein
MMLMGDKPSMSIVVCGRGVRTLHFSPFNAEALL